MGEESGLPGPEPSAEPEVRGVAALEAEIERLRAENEALALRADASARPGRSRAVWSIVLIVVGALVAGSAVPALWLNRTVMNTDNWVSTVAPLASDPAIQDAVAGFAAEALIERVNAEEVAREALPEKAQILATPIASAVDSFIRQETRKLVRSEQFAKVWEESNRVGHQTVIALVGGHQGKVVTSASGKVTVDLTALLEQVQGGLVDRGLSFVSRVPVSQFPNREITLVDSPALASAGTALKLLNQTALALPLLALALLGAAVALALDRRKAVLWVGIAVVVAMLLPIEAIYLARYPYIHAIRQAATIPVPAALSMYDIVFRDLLMTQRWVLVFGLILWAGAVVAGPTRWAVALRGGVAGGVQGVGTAWDFGAFGEWVHAHEKGLRSLGLITGVFALLFWRIDPLARLIWIGVLVLVWLLAIEFFGRPSPVGALAEERADTEDPTASVESDDPSAGSPSIG